MAGIDNDRVFEIPLSDIYVRLRVMCDEDSQADTEEYRDSGPIDIQVSLLTAYGLGMIGVTLLHTLSLEKHV